MQMKLDKGMPISLNDQVAHPDLMWPTPAARDYKDTGENTDYEKLAKKSKLAGAVKSKMYPTPRSSIGMSMTMDTVVNAMDNNDRGYKGNLEERVAIEENMWLTPSATNISERSEEALEKREKMRNKSGRKTVPPGSLAEQVQYGYPTTDMRQEKMWPTPNASDNRDRGNMSDPAIQRRIAKGKQVGLTMAVKDKPGKGTLNPEWVEWLMGYPQGWTDITDSSESPTSQE
jgi:DNA (cytosine-5)-methyltransferase 1